MNEIMISKDSKQFLEQYCKDTECSTQEAIGLMLDIGIQKVKSEIEVDRDISEWVRKSILKKFTS